MCIYFDAVEAAGEVGGWSVADVDDVGGSIVSHGQTLHAVPAASAVVSSCFGGSLHMMLEKVVYIIEKSHARKKDTWNGRNVNV